MLRVQLVEILYTKDSRGAPASTVRNQLPRAFPLNVSSHASYAFETVRLREADGFSPKLTAREEGVSIPRSQDHLLIEAREDRVLLGLRWSSSLGQPAREPRPRVIELQPGETAQLIINGRYTSYSGQLYTEATYNVAFGESLAVDVFLQATAPKVFDLRANLF